MIGHFGVFGTITMLVQVYLMYILFAMFLEQVSGYSGRGAGVLACKPCQEKICLRGFRQGSTQPQKMARGV